MLSTVRVPNRHDPRLPVVAILSCYLVLGVTVLGFNRSPAQIASVIGMACALDFILHRLVYKQWLFPLSAVITGMSLSILVNYAHGSLLPAVPIFMAIASKYVITHNGRHVFNPALFGIVAALVLGGNMMSVSPSYQWGGYPAMAMFVVTAAILTFGLKIKRGVLIVSFLSLYTLALCLRAYLTRHHVPPETIFLGAVTSPAFYLFTFFMITDPMTSPNSKVGQFVMALFIVIVDFYLHTRESLSTFFYAGFLYFALRWAWLHSETLWYRARRAGDANTLSDEDSTKVNNTKANNASVFKRIGWPVLFGAFGWMFMTQVYSFDTQSEPEFSLVEVASSGLSADAIDGGILDKVDDRIKNVAKWVLSVGDAAAVADFDNDGLQDIFLTYPLKASAARGALYRNSGNMQFERVPLPAIQARMANEKTGLPSSALWFDHDNDGDSDLFIGMGYGKNVMLHNNLVETGIASFTDVSESMGVSDYAVSVSANVLDADGDGDLDLLVGNSLNPWLPDYDTPTAMNVFDLPQPGYDNDRRMFNFMHRTWHNASNGGENYFYINNGNRFNRMSPELSGLDGQRWTIDIGTADLDNDGDTDLYLANDFGPDELFLNTNGRFSRILGRLSGQLGKDTYKGMNASMADFDNNGSTDIYVSNVHEPLQAEGSMLWMNDGSIATNGWRALSDRATAKNALNERRFGWGASTADLNLDGRMDVLQANGMVGNEYDKLYEGCPDYWYWNEKIALTNPDVHGYSDQWADLRGRCIFPNEHDRVMLNHGRYFVDAAKQVGWTSTESSRGIATADFDNDGDLDVVVTHQFSPVMLFENQQRVKPNWIGLDLTGNGSSCNTDAIGSKVKLHLIDSNAQSGMPKSAAVTVQYRETVASNGFSSQNDSRVVFGLASHNDQVMVMVIVNWCGKQKISYELEPNQYHQLQQPDASDDSIASVSTR